METIEEDIRTKKASKLVHEFRDHILDTAKNIKSNDSTFNTCTLNEVSADLTKLMGGYSDIMQKIEASEKAFEHLLQHINDKQELEASQFQELFETTCDDFLRDYKHDNGAQAQLDALIRPVAPVQDEEVVVEAPAERVWPKDPITKTPIQKAVRNKVCKHIYDRTSIENYIEQKKANKQRVACPVAGCQNKNTSSKDLIPDDETNNLIETMRG